MEVSDAYRYTARMEQVAFRVLREVVELCQREHTRYWVVGGFAVDAKIGHLTRTHGDVDVCIHEQDLQVFLKACFGQGFRVTQQGLKYVLYTSECKVDVFELFDRGEFYEREREWFHARYPKEIFDHVQVLPLNGLQLRIPSNEALRYYVVKTIHPDDRAFVDQLPFNAELYAKIQYVEFADYHASTQDVPVKEIHFS